MIKKPKQWVSYLLYSLFPWLVGSSILSGMANIEWLIVIPGFLTALFAHALTRSRIQNVFLSIGIIATMGYFHAFILVGLVLGFDNSGAWGGFGRAEQVGLANGIAALAVSIVLVYVNAYVDHKASARFRH
jgi:hypothetical protein